MHFLKTKPLSPPQPPSFEEWHLDNCLFRRIADSTCACWALRWASDLISAAGFARHDGHYCGTEQNIGTRWREESCPGCRPIWTSWSRVPWSGPLPGCHGEYNNRLADGRLDVSA